MLSILIPTYNYICVNLVRDLQRQAAMLEKPFEILVADDASAEECKRENRTINTLPGCKYIELPENVGRARIRNILGRTAQYDWLLFIDSDARVLRSDFLSRYLAASTKADVVYGGLAHPAELPAPDMTLSYRYEKQAERLYTPQVRQKKPYGRFRTFNFLIKRSVFLAHPFDETIVRYGHEDTLLGKQLEEARVEVLHIDNPLLNEGLDNNARFLQKTEESLRTLYECRGKLAGSSGVLRLYALLQRWHCTRLTACLFRALRPLLRRQLCSRRPLLCLFAGYKIGYYCCVTVEADSRKSR